MEIDSIGREEFKADEERITRRASIEAKLLEKLLFDYQNADLDSVFYAYEKWKDKLKKYDPCEDRVKKKFRKLFKATDRYFEEHGYDDDDHDEDDDEAPMQGSDWEMSDDEDDPIEVKNPVEEEDGPVEAKNDTVEVEGHPAEVKNHPAEIENEPVEVKDPVEKELHLVVSAQKNETEEKDGKDAKDARYKMRKMQKLQGVQQMKKMKKMKKMQVVIKKSSFAEAKNVGARSEPIKNIVMKEYNAEALSLRNPKMVADCFREMVYDPGGAMATIRIITSWTDIQTKRTQAGHRTEVRKRFENDGK